MSRLLTIAVIIGVCLGGLPGTELPALAAVGDTALPSAVWGQPNFDSGHCQRTGARSLCGPGQAVRDIHGNLWVADFANNRVVMYPPGGNTALKVFGQYGSFSTRGCNQPPPGRSGYAPAPNKFTLCQPIGVAVDARGTLYVADSINNRIMIYFHADQKPTDAAADRVLGQPNFHSTASNNAEPLGFRAPGCKTAGPANRCSFNGPMELSLDFRGDLLVPDFDNHRVLLWSSASLDRLESPLCSRGCPILAARVWGQYGSFTSNLANNPHVPSHYVAACTQVTLAHPDNACTLSGPWAAVSDKNGDLFVSDTDNNRVLEYERALTNGRQDATAVYGQAGSMRSASGNDGGLSASSLWHPVGLALDLAGDLWTADFYNKRVLEFPPPGAQRADRAVRVLGQEGRFDTKTCASSRQGLCGPTSVAFDTSGDVYVVDGLNSRVLEYTSPAN